MEIESSMISGIQKDSFVWSSGLRTIEEAFGSKAITGPGGLAAVSGWHDGGKRKGRLVGLACGLEIDGAASQRVLTRMRSGGEEWTRVGNLTTNHYVAVARGRADFGTTKIPLDEAYAVGLLIADGSIMLNNSGRSQALQIDKQVPVLKAVMPVLIRWRAIAGGISSDPIKIIEKSDNNACVKICAINFVSMFEKRYGIKWAYSENRIYPSRVMTGTREVVRAFLRGYFDGDGFCVGRPGISSASRALAEQNASDVARVRCFRRNSYQKNAYDDKRP
jgi:intein/homing endonuclease